MKPGHLGVSANTKHDLHRLLFFYLHSAVQKAHETYKARKTDHLTA